MASAICTEFGARKVIAAATVPSATRRLKFTAANWGSLVQEPGPGSETETIAANIRCAVAKSADLKNTQPTRTAANVSAPPRYGLRAMPANRRHAWLISK